MKLDMFKWIIKYGAWCAAGILLFCACSDTAVSDGGGSRGGNPVVIGKITGQGGAGAANVSVSLIDEEYCPLTDTLPGCITTVTTDSLGEFSIIAPCSGLYNIEAVGGKNGARMIRFKIKTVQDSITVLQPDTLRMPGTIKVNLPKGSNAADACVYVPGTTIIKSVSGTADSIVIDNVPAGVLPVLYLRQKNSAEKTVISHDVRIESDSTTLINNWQWSHNRRIVLNTSASGAGIKANVYDFVVLIRLSSKNFDFTEALDSGKDVRFSTIGGRQLTHEIEEWDAAGKSAAIWVKVDTVYGNNDSQSITMYWGNPAATDASDGAAVFDTASGYQGVWHLSDAEGNKISDATVNNYAGMSPDGATPLLTQGIVGKGRFFNGIDNYISMPNTADSKLDFPETGDFTISAWVSIDTFDGLPHVVVAKGYDQHFIRSTGASGTPLLNFAQLGSNDIWQVCTTSAVDRKWTFVTGVRQGNRQFIYCNGILADSIPKSFESANFTRNSSNDISIGAFLKVVNSTDGKCFFKGAIDEVRMLNRVKSSDWVLLCYMNQRSDDRLVFFK